VQEDGGQVTVSLTAFMKGGIAYPFTVVFDDTGRIVREP
jgi:hypothetical protein